MSDIYKALAARIAGKPEDQVTHPERERAKAAFFAALTEVAQLPGNTALRAALQGSQADGIQFANIEWQPRWNNPAAPHAGLTQDGPQVFATGFFGILKFSLDDKASCEAIVTQARLFATMVEEAAIDYLGG